MSLYEKKTCKFNYTAIHNAQQSQTSASGFQAVFIVVWSESRGDAQCKVGVCYAQNQEILEVCSMGKHCQKTFGSLCILENKIFFYPNLLPTHNCESKHFPGSPLKETFTESYPISLFYVSIIAANFPFCDTQRGINCLEIMPCATSESVWRFPKRVPEHITILKDPALLALSLFQDIRSTEYSWKSWFLYWDFLKIACRKACKRGIWILWFISLTR